MAKEEKEIKEEPKTETAKTEEVKAFKVKKEVTVDKLYKPGSTIYLPEGKIKDSLISNKFI